MCRFQTIKEIPLLEHPGVPRIRQRSSNFIRIRDGLEGRPAPADDKVSELPAVGAAGEDAALLYDVVATAELDAARTPPSTESECDDDDAALLMALKAAPCAS